MTMKSQNSVHNYKLSLQEKSKLTSTISSLVLATVEDFGGKTPDSTSFLLLPLLLCVNFC